jgi:hypothetical protein
MIEDDGATGLVKAEQLIDFDPIVAIHIVGGLDLVGGVTTATSSRVDSAVVRMRSTSSRVRSSSK